MKKFLWLLTLLNLTFVILLMPLSDSEQRKIDELQEQIENLQANIGEIRGQMSGIGKINFPPDLETRKSVEKSSDYFLKDKIFDLIWKKTFHYYWFLETLDGIDITKVGAGGTATQSAANGDLTITTDVATNDKVTLFKKLSWQGLFTFSQRSAFRTQITMSNNTSQTTYIVIGALSSNFYGFKIVDGTLYGVSSNNGTANESTVAIQTIPGGGDVYNLEARYLPGHKIGFYVINTAAGTIPELGEKGVLTTNLPSPALVARSTIWTVEVKTTTTAARNLQISFIEYLQMRNILK